MNKLLKIATYLYYKPRTTTNRGKLFYAKDAKL